MLNVAVLRVGMRGWSMLENVTPHGFRCLYWLSIGSLARLKAYALVLYIER